MVGQQPCLKQSVWGDPRKMLSVGRDFLSHCEDVAFCSL